MPDEINQTYTSENTTDTEGFSESIGKRLKGGEVIELISDLGGGKTTFVRGLAKGFGSDDRVASPTFTISRIYKSGDKTIHHFDFYRVAEAGVVGHELEEIMNNPHNTVVVEWAQVVEDVLPKERLQITIERLGDDRRTFRLRYPKNLDYLVPQDVM